jgi:hypothetical protein
MRSDRAALFLAAVAVLCVPLSGCLVMGYSSGSGWWVWPGSLVITLVLVLVWLLARR